MRRLRLLGLALLAAFYLAMTSCMVFVRPAGAQGSAVTRRFLEDHISVVFWIHVTTNETFIVNGIARVDFAVETVAVRENASLYVSSVEVFLADTNVAASQPILENLTATGQRAEASLLLSVSDPGFNSIEPGERMKYALSIDIRGELRDDTGELQPLDVERSMNVNVLSPEAPAALDVVVPQVVAEGELFQLIARLDNDGLFPVTSVRFHVSGYELRMLQGQYRLVSQVDAGKSVLVEFPVMFEAMGFHAVDVDVSYWSFGGYNVSLTRSVLVNVKGVSTVSCQVSQLGAGADFNIYGAVQPSRPSVLVTLEYSVDDGVSWKTLGETETHLNGSYSRPWTAAARGTHLFRASWEGDESFLGAQSQEARLDVARDISHITLSLSSSRIVQDGEVVITGNVIPPQGSGVVKLSYRLEREPWNTISVVETRADGSFEHSWRPPGSGTYYVKASWDGNAGYFGADSPSLTLTVAGEAASLADEVISFLYSPLAIGLLVVVAAVVVLLVIRVRRKGLSRE